MMLQSSHLRNYEFDQISGNDQMFSFMHYTRCIVRKYLSCFAQSASIEISLSNSFLYQYLTLRSSLRISPSQSYQMPSHLMSLSLRLSLHLHIVFFAWYEIPVHTYLTTVQHPKVLYLSTPFLLDRSTSFSFCWFVPSVVSAHK